MTIGVVIPTLNEASYIANCLESLITQSLNPDEVIVVDDSTDETSSLVRSFTSRFSQLNIKFLHINGAGCGVAAARHLGFTRCNSDIIVSLDADCIAAPQWLESLCEPIIQANTQATTGKIVMSDAPVMIRKITQLGWYGWYYRLVKRFFGFHLFSTANGALTKVVYQKSGGFNYLKQDINELDDAELAARLHPLTPITFVAGAQVTTSFRRFRKPKRAITTTFKRMNSLRQLSSQYRNN